MITVSRKELINELEWANRFTEKKSTIPIIQSVLLRATEGKLSLEATDLEIAGKTFLDAKSSESWSAAANVGTLLKYLKKADESTVSLSLDNKKLTITHGANGSVSLDFMSDQSFPVLPDGAGIVGTIVGLDVALPKVLISISCEEGRFTLNGGLLESKNGQTKLIATDGHRMSLADLLSDLPDCKALLPKSGLSEVQRIAKPEQPIALKLLETHAIFSIGKREVIMRKLTGNFPEYERVIPVTHDHAVQLPLKDFIKAAERVSLFSDDRSKGVTVSFDAGRVSIGVSNHDGGSARNEMPVEFSGESWQSGINSMYLLEGLKLMNSVSMQLTRTADGGNTKPMMFVDGSFQYLVMPQRI